MKASSRRCKTCRKKVPAESAFTSQLRAFCSYECLSEFTRSESGQKVVHLDRKKDLRERKAKLLTRSDYLKLAQAAFNAYIRYRDDDDACISCGNYTMSDLMGGGWDAGHYRSTGSAQHLRVGGFLAALNCHKQCVKCNRFLSGNVAEYRKRLIKKIGQDLVDKIEADQDSRNYSIEDLQRITLIYRKRKRIHSAIRKNKNN
jgi:endogenous inhibitor of DNA gyrase (YacG/DUF329 family)